jgi:polysaccharide biosynthesis transport protein
VTAPASLLSWAAVPHRPSSLSPLLFAAPVLVAFLVIGCIVALLRDRLDQGIYTNTDVGSELGLPCAGLVPSSPGFLPAQIATSVSSARTITYTDAVQGILVSILCRQGLATGRLRAVLPEWTLPPGAALYHQLSALRKRKPKVILITSSVPGEGKSTLARGLAVCAAQSGAKVLLLGLDDRAQTRRCGTPGSDDDLHWLLEYGAKADSRGRVDLLAQDRALIELVPTGTGTALHYLPIRRPPAAKPSPLFSIDKMSQVWQRLRSTYDLVFVDCASVLARSEVRLLAAISDHVVFVVRWRKTRRDDARTALGLLHDCVLSGAPSAVTISAAITQVDLKRHAAVGIPSGALAKTG